MTDQGTFHLRWRGRQIGPFTWEEIERRLQENEIGLLHEIQWQGRWLTIEEFIEARAALIEAESEREEAELRRRAEQSRAAGAEAGHDSSAAPEGTSAEVLPEIAAELVQRRRWVFALLGVLFGFAGAHNFYAGFHHRGVAQVVCSVVLVLLGLGFLATWIWAWIEVLLVRHDRHRVPMK